MALLKAFLFKMRFHAFSKMPPTAKPIFQEPLQSSSTTQLFNPHECFRCPQRQTAVSSFENHCGNVLLYGTLPGHSRSVIVHWYATFYMRSCCNNLQMIAALCWANQGVLNGLKKDAQIDSFSSSQLQECTCAWISAFCSFLLDSPMFGTKRKWPKTEQVRFN